MKKIITVIDASFPLYLTIHMVILQPRSQSSSAISDVTSRLTSPVKFVGKIRLGRLANNGKSKMAAPSLGFGQILEEMQKAMETGWDSLVNVCYEIREVVGEGIYG